MAEMAVRYIGGGAFIQGVPARDMTPEEWDQMPVTVRAFAVEIGLYEEVTGVGNGEDEDE